MSEFFKFALDDAENNNPLTLAEKLIVEVIESKEAAKLYADDLIEALARAGTIKQYEAKRRFQAAFGKEFAIREWTARIKLAEAEILGPRGEVKYVVSEKGTIKALVANAVIMLADAPVAYDSFKCRVVVTGPLPWRPGSTGTNWTDDDDVRAAMWCQHQQLPIPSHLAAEAAQTIARQNPIHPVRDYLDAQLWDGERRLDTWLTHCMGCEDTPYVRGVAAKWMISAVARVMEPGCQADYTLVFEGVQGKRKSTAMRELCGSPWFSDDLTEIGTKDSAMQLQGNWIVEIGELDAFRRAEMTTIKQWLVKRVDEFRPPYGRRTEEFPRQNVFAATTNKYDWGQDDTGLRRFWPVRVIGKIDIERLKANRDQLWAEARFRYDEGEKWFLSEEAEAVAAVEQHQRQERDAWSDRIEDWIGSPMIRQGGDDLRSTQNEIYVPDILYHCLGILPKDWNHAHKLRVNRILRVAGYEAERATRKDENGKRPEFWRRR